MLLNDKNTPITLWYRYMKYGDGNIGWEFNHIEDGHCPNATPTPKDPSHKSAWAGRWAKAFAALDNTNKVVHFMIVEK